MIDIFNLTDSRCTKGNEPLGMSLKNVLGWVN